MAKEITWVSVLQTVMAMPGVTVDRDSFLKDCFSAYCDKDTVVKIIDGKPFLYVTDKLIETVANTVIKEHTSKVTMISAAAGIPGGLGMFVAVPADVAQYYYHILVLVQKLAYIYGYPDLRNEVGKLSKGSLAIITLFVGVMSGVVGANKAIQEIVEQLVKGAVKEISQKVLEKAALYPAIVNVAKNLGIAITKKSVSQTVSKIIPLIGAVISGSLTFAGFYPSAKKLQKRLLKDMESFKLADNHVELETETENINQ